MIIDFQGNLMTIDGYKFKLFIDGNSLHDDSDQFLLDVYDIRNELDLLDGEQIEWLRDRGGFVSLTEYDVKNICASLITLINN